MPRKKRAEAAPAAGQSAGTETITDTAVTTDAAQPSDLPPIARPEWIDGPSLGRHDADLPGIEGAEVPKHWGDPYKSIFSCHEQAFELGENRRFKQRVFQFQLKPTDEILAELKDAGFTYRAAEKAWTIPANPDTRKLTDELARKWAGPNYVQGVER